MAALAISIVGQLLFVLPGVLIVRAIAGPAASWLAPAAFGPLVGHGVTSVALLALWAAGGRGLWTIPVASLLALVLVPPLKKLQGRWRLPAVAPRDSGAVTALLLIVPLLVALPFANVGAALPDGQAYRAYFTADYVWRRAVVIELAKGDFLPVNPFYLGDSLHYYWLPHLLNAVEYRAAPTRIDLDSLLVAHSVFIDLFFVAFLYGVVRAFAIRPWAAAAGVAAIIVCSSYEGVWAVISHALNGAPFQQVRNLNIDAVSRWFYGGMPIDGLQRVLFYQPHHATAYATGLMGLLVVAFRTRAFDPGAFAVAGTLLALSTLLSSFSALMFTAAAALFEALALVRAFDWRRAMAHAAAAGLPIASAAGLVLVLGYVDRGGSVLMVGLNPVSTTRVILTTFLSVGPVLILGVAATVMAWREGLADLRVLAVLAVTTVVFYFFVDVRDHQNVYVGWRAGHLLFMASAVTFGLLFDRASQWRANPRALAFAGLAVVLAPATVTTAIDVYNTQDITNRSEAPGFLWTLVITHDDRQVFDWIRETTPPEAVFQVDPAARNSHTWAYLPAFAERRMWGGLPISMVPLAKYEQATREASALYDADAGTVYDEARKRHIEYLVVGPPERQAHPGVEQRLSQLPDLLPVVFQNASITVYKVR